MEELKRIVGKGAGSRIGREIKKCFKSKAISKQATTTMVKEKYIEMFGHDVLPKAKKHRDVNTESDLSDESASEDDGNQPQRYGIIFQSSLNWLKV